jgi:hypothetical protein
MSGCSKKESAPTETTQIETTVDPEEKFKVDIPLEIVDTTKEVIGTDADGGTTGLTYNGEIAYNSGRYGDLGKDVYDGLVDAWVKGIFKNEAELRETMDSVYGNLNTKEELTKEILATPRDTQPTQLAKETKPASTDNKAETKSQSQSETATPPTKADTAQPTNSNTATYHWEPSTSPDWTPEDEARMQAQLKEWEENPAQVGDGGTGTPINADDAAAKWGWN